MLADMYSDGFIDTVVFSAKKNHGEYSPTITDYMVVEEAY